MTIKKHKSRVIYDSTRRIRGNNASFQSCTNELHDTNIVFVITLFSNRFENKALLTCEYRCFLLITVKYVG
jgi:hypothetical protein